MSEVAILLMLLVFAGLSWGLVVLCDHLAGGKQ